MASPALLCPQLDRLEPLDVLSVEEHESDGGHALVHLPSTRIRCTSPTTARSHLKYQGYKVIIKSNHPKHKKKLVLGFYYIILFDDLYVKKNKNSGDTKTDGVLDKSTIAFEGH